jgi:hypothetical protein
VGGAAPGLSPRTKVAEKERKRPPAKPPGGFDLRREGKGKGKRRNGRKCPNHPRKGVAKRGKEGKRERNQKQTGSKKEKKSSRGLLAKPKEPRAKRLDVTDEVLL